MSIAEDVNPRCFKQRESTVSDDWDINTLRFEDVVSIVQCAKDTIGDHLMLDRSIPELEYCQPIRFRVKKYLRERHTLSG